VLKLTEQGITQPPVFLGMGHIWQIFATICLLCSQNLSSEHMAKCNPNVTFPGSALKIDKNITDKVVLG